MNKSESINELAAALCKAQAVIKGAVEDSTNPHFKSKYASLQSYLDAAREPLTKNNLSVTQLLSDLNCEAMKMVTIETLLMHSSGQWISSTFSVPVSKQDAQGFGSAITYARRYAFAAIVGIAPIDDDGNAATEAAPNKGADKAKALPVSVVRGIENAPTIEALMQFASEQTDYHKHPQFRQMVQARKEVLA
jgi:ERF superfamily